MNRFCIGAVIIAVFTAEVNAARADEPILPGKGFVSTRYEVLWTKSPFSVASSTESAASPDYSLTGLAQFDGVSYASLFDKQKQEHFVLSSDKPLNGLTLVSVNRAQESANSSAVIQKNGSGESITLKLESQPVAATPPPTGNGGPIVNLPPPTMPPISNPQGQRQPGNPTALGPAQTPPPPLFHRHTITVPPPPSH